jgi:SAM-dependent methyltransferase
MTSDSHLVAVGCSICGSDDGELVGRGYDYEYFTCKEAFNAYRCRGCGNVYLNPRPDISEFVRIYPASYHALNFSEANYGVVHDIRSRLEARRLLRYCKGIPDDARILDVGCGDGFHLKLLQRFGKSGWTLEGVDLDARAVALASRSGLSIHQGSIEKLPLPEAHYDLVSMIQTIEHVARPDAVFAAISRLLKPGGRLVVVTDNTDSIDFAWFRRSYWGGYHFPRHWNLFNRRSLKRLAQGAGLEIESIRTIVSPVNWVYSIHNLLVGKGAPQWLINRFTLESPISLGTFTLLDMVLQKFGRGALLNGVFSRKS